MAETVRNCNGSEDKIILSSPLQLKGLIPHTDVFPKEAPLYTRTPPGKYQNIARGTARQGVYMWTAILS